MRQSVTPVLSTVASNASEKHAPLKGLELLSARCLHVQAFLFPQLSDNQNVWRVSYQRLGAKTVSEARGLAKVTDTEAYYKSLTQDGTTSGALLCLTCPLPQSSANHHKSMMPVYAISAVRYILQWAATTFGFSAAHGDFRHQDNLFLSP